ncbi:MAG: transporter, partial [Spartobacteria bacterium]|nr:transporter [Spartobacteria bacterium]
MKQVKLLAGTLGVAAVLAAQSAFGAGFGIYEGSARGNALGTEVTADPASPSVLYNNAAGMTELEGTQMEAGATLIRPHQTVYTTTPAGSVENKADSKWWTPPNAYVTHQFNDKVWTGLGIFSRYGLGVEYDDDWMGRYNVQEATIQSIDVNP